MVKYCYLIDVNGEEFFVFVGLWVECEYEGILVWIYIIFIIEV